MSFFLLISSDYFRNVTVKKNAANNLINTSKMKCHCFPMLHSTQTYVCLALCRFEIEKKLRKAKKKEREKKDKRTAEAFAMRSVSQRSQERRKIIEGKKDTKKMSALQDLKAKREEKRKQGTLLVARVQYYNYSYI